MSSAAERKKAADAIAKRVSGSKASKSSSSSCVVIALAIIVGMTGLLSSVGEIFS